MARSLAAQPYLSLDEYRKLFGIPICSFNGVENPDETKGKCDHYWSQMERDMLAQALNDAEGMMASELRFWLGPRFLADHNLNWRDPTLLRYGWVIGAGVQQRDEVTPSASDFTTDPATITVPSASFSGGTDEIVIIEDSSGLEIEPDTITTVGANHVVSISQCKLIEWDNLENQASSDPIPYDNTFPATTWLKLADLTVYRQYRSTLTQATIHYGPSCNCWCAGEACGGTEYTACVFVTDTKVGAVRVNRATYGNGAWACDNSAICGCYEGDTVTVYYEAGATDTPGWKQSVYRLAHTLIEQDPCGCSLFRRAWRRDTRIPPVLTRERLNCQWGEMDGAWYSWQWMRHQQHGRAFMLG